jgi:propane 2-monooxygenase small subunit
VAEDRPTSPAATDEERSTSPEATPEETPTGRTRSVPKLVFTDAEAGALEFPSSGSRAFNYFEPERMRATMYEDVTVDVQPDPGRYLTQNWVYGFRDGPGGFPEEWTQAKSSDWHWFRDPNREWEQTIYRNNANVVRQIQQNLDNAKNEDGFAGWSRGWTDVVEKHVSAWMHPEHGLGMHVFLPAQRDAPTNMINNAISVNSMHKLRFAQDLALYNLTVSESIDGFNGKAHRETWMNDAAWQGVRENVEQLTAIRDWCEAVVKTNLIFEPLVGELFRSGFVMQVAATNGDFVTPTLMGSGETDYERDLLYTRELVRGLTSDSQHAEVNKKLLGEWIADASEQGIRAARQLQPVWSQPPEKPVRFEDSLDRAKERMRGILADLDLRPIKELEK